MFFLVIYFFVFLKEFFIICLVLIFVYNFVFFLGVLKKEIFKINLGCKRW